MREREVDPSSKPTTVRRCGRKTHAHGTSPPPCHLSWASVDWMQKFQLVHAMRLSLRRSNLLGGACLPPACMFESGLGTAVGPAWGAVGFLMFDIIVSLTCSVLYFYLLFFKVILSFLFFIFLFGFLYLVILFT